MNNLATLIAPLLFVASASAADADLVLTTGEVRSGIAITSLPFTVTNRSPAVAEFVSVECTFFDGDQAVGSGLALLDPIAAASSVAGEVIVAKLRLAKRAECRAVIVE